MSIYDLIADHYSEIFPPDNNRLEFLSSYLSGKARILDTGCATGDIAAELAASGHNVTGIDLNEKMISIAWDKTKDRGLEIDFKLMDMLRIKELGEFNLIMCFGNTLPHLQSESDVEIFFHSVFDSLSKNGYFIFQILNYDKILSEGKINFQAIENDSFVFRRSYSFPESGKIVFKTEFEDKPTGSVYSASTNLLPLKREFLLSMLDKAKFKSIEIFSGYGRSKSDMKEFATLYTAQKTV